MKIVYAVCLGVSMFCIGNVCAVWIMALYHAYPHRPLIVCYNHDRCIYDMDEVIAQKMWEPVDEMDSTNPEKTRNDAACAVCVK